VDDVFRRQWAAQLAQERADEARAFRPAPDERPERRPLERSRWLGLQVRSLLALVAVAEEGSFVGAARRLGYSRSTISHQIAQLESAVGVSLVVRGAGSRSVAVTPAGGIVVAHGRAVLRLLENAEAQVTEAGRLERRRRRLAHLRWDADAPPVQP
jgi:molybdenum-dependent DNA-binding transcriptional regulator ModE